MPRPWPRLFRRPWQKYKTTSVCEIPRSLERASPSNFRTQGSFIHMNSRKIFERDLLSSDSVAKFATQKPWVFWDWLLRWVSCDLNCFFTLFYADVFKVSYARGGGGGGGRGPTLFRSDLSKFLSALRCFFSNFCPSKVPFSVPVRSRLQFFRKFALGRLKWGIMSSLGSYK